MFGRRVPEFILRIDELIAPVGQGSGTWIRSANGELAKIFDDLLPLLTEAYRAASKQPPTTLPAG